MGEVFVHPRVSERHPELTDADVLTAWRNCITSRPRLDAERETFVAIGIDMRGRLLEMVAIREDRGDWLIYHAYTPPTMKIQIELGIFRR